MSDEISLNKSWTIEAYVAHNESMRLEADKRNDDLRAEFDRRYEQRFAAQEKAVEAALTSAKEAVLKAEAASEKRFESINEFRRTLSDQAQQFASAEKVNDLVSRFDRLEGRSSGLDAGWVKLVSVIGLIVGLVAIGTAIIKWS